MENNSKIFIAGHNGMVGSAILRKLRKLNFNNILLKKSSDLNLINQKEVEDFFLAEKPEYVFIAAAKVGGILENSNYPAQFIYNNLMIQNNIIHASHNTRVKKLLFLGSSCIYPRNCIQPMKEEYLLSNYLEKTNESYAIAKISGIKICESYYKEYGDNFISIMPTNLYGPNDNFDLDSSHVMPALIRKFHEAKKNNYNNVEIWGTGSPLREFLHVDELADACLHIFLKYDAKYIYNDLGISHINVGSGSEISIKNLSLLIKEIVGYKGDLIFDKSKPDGTMKKLLCCSILKKMGWFNKIELKDGILKTYNWYLKNYKN